MAQDDPALNADAPGPVAFGFDKALDLVLPPQCLSCGCLLPARGTLCTTCWTEMAFMAEPWCRQCGLPFIEDPGQDASCGACLRRPPPFARARAVLAYNDASRGMILAFKHGDRTDMAPAFATWMARVGAALVADSDLIVPVPLHWTRLWRRRFNQAAMMAGALSRLADRPFAPRTLTRRRRTPSQAGLNFTGRARNVRGAFAVKSPGDLVGRRVLLIDDVYTTGATASACARVLCRAGARAVDVLTLARVIRS